MKPRPGNTETRRRGDIPASPRPRVAGSRGIALIVVLWISVILTLLLYAFLIEMRAESSLADGYANRKKAEQLALSAIDKAIVTLTSDTRTHHTLADPWANSETEWFESSLGDGVFTALRPAYKDGKVAWGLIDETSKLNLNVAPKEALLKLPGMTEEIADSIIDWRDSDDTPGANGAESSYYQVLQPGYRCKNANFETVEELLYVKGVTATLFWGEDRNQNGILDPNEDTDGDGTLDYGFYPFVTVYSVDKDVRADGSARLDLNTGQAQYKQDLGDVLDDPTIQRMQQYILQSGPYLSIAHLLDVQGVTSEKFKKIADRVTVLGGQITDVPGRINVNTAPKQVLLALPNVREEFVDALIAYRTTSGVDLSNIGWILDVNMDDGTKLQQLKEIASYVTVRSYQFRIDALGRIGEKVEGTITQDEGKPFAFRRIVAVYDKGAQTPRLVYFKDMSGLGFPYDPWEKPESP